jgi:hypothetical protein
MSALRIGCSTTELPRRAFTTIAEAEKICQFNGEFEVLRTTGTRMAADDAGLREENPVSSAGS